MNDTKGMSYLEIVANGNAGEFYFAYWISRNYTWPCRILDIDMGLDAQIEIFDGENHSTGMFIGVQVKTTFNTFEESPSVSVPLKNIVYWESIKDPIVIVRVCLNKNLVEPCIYWQHLQKSDLKNYINNANLKESETVTINFQKDENLLLKENKKAWVEFFLSEDDKNFIEGCESIRRKLKYFWKHFKGGSDGDNFKNGLPDNQFASELNDLLNKYDDLKQAIKVNPRLINLSEEVSSTVDCYNSYITIILEAFEYACSCDSIFEDDLDEYSQTNPEISKIMNKY